MPILSLSQSSFLLDRISFTKMVDIHCHITVAAGLTKIMLLNSIFRIVCKNSYIGFLVPSLFLTRYRKNHVVNSNLCFHFIFLTFLLSLFVCVDFEEQRILNSKYFIRSYINMGKTHSLHLNFRFYLSFPNY